MNKKKPEVVIIQIRPLKTSATNTVPVEDTDNPFGPLKEATVPNPSAQEDEPDPAKVPTTPESTHIRSLEDYKSG